jgi:molybdopterin synthase catalytic subunit
MHGKKVTKLEYESYESMALKEMKNVCDSVRKMWPDVHGIAIYHRLGEVAIKEESIIIAISSPHRKESLEAASFCINEVKKVVPIWKKVILISLLFCYVICDLSK